MRSFVKTATSAVARAATYSRSGIAARSWALPSASAAVRTATSSLVVRTQPFSTSRAVMYASAGESDADLAHKLSEELKYEKEAEADEDIEFIDEYLKKSKYALKSAEGSNDIYLTRTFGNENITIHFTVADIYNRDADMSKISSLGDQEFDVDESADPAKRAQELKEAMSSHPQGMSRQSRNVREEDEDYDEDMDEEPYTEYPVRITASIAKAGQPTLSVEMTAEGDMYEINRIFFAKDGEVAVPKTAEADWQRAGGYQGPTFGHLEEDLKVSIERYLEERGIDSAMCTFVVDYIEHKEQLEYMRWLNNFKKFVQA
ncbi:mitochondrial glycoprotein [Ramicandelaber brevisporus]|nr:mitochondrial glycoprotein [Ramicandelaber brevisporus]